MIISFIIFILISWFCIASLLYSKQRWFRDMNRNANMTTKVSNGYCGFSIGFSSFSCRWKHRLRWFRVRNVGDNGPHSSNIAHLSLISISSLSLEYRKNFFFVDSDILDRRSSLGERTRLQLLSFSSCDSELSNRSCCGDRSNSCWSTSSGSGNIDLLRRIRGLSYPLLNGRTELRSSRSCMVDSCALTEGMDAVMNGVWTFWRYHHDTGFFFWNERRSRNCIQHENRRQNAQLFGENLEIMWFPVLAIKLRIFLGNAYFLIPGLRLHVESNISMCLKSTAPFIPHRQVTIDFPTQK